MAYHVNYRVQAGKGIKYLTSVSETSEINSTYNTTQNLFIDRFSLTALYVQFFVADLLAASGPRIVKHLSFKSRTVAEDEMDTSWPNHRPCPKRCTKRCAKRCTSTETCLHGASSRQKDLRLSKMADEW